MVVQVGKARLDESRIFELMARRGSRRKKDRWSGKMKGHFQGRRIIVVTLWLLLLMHHAGSSVGESDDASGDERDHLGHLQRSDPLHSNFNHRAILSPGGSCPKNDA
jgi:hypothetical protein